MALGDMTGEEMDMFDLGQVQGRKLVFVSNLVGYDASMLKGLVKSQTKTLAKLKARADHGEFMDGVEIRKHLLSAMRQKQEKYRKQLKSNNTALVPQIKSDSVIAGAYNRGCHFTASTDIYSKIECLAFVKQEVTFHRAFHVPFLSLQEMFAYGVINNADYLKTDYLLIDFEDARAFQRFEDVSFKDLGMTLLNYKVTIVFQEGSCIIRQWQDYVMIMYDAVSGQFSVLIQYALSDVDLQFSVSSSSGPINVKGINVSVQSDVGVEPPAYYDSDPKLFVTFDASWDDLVSNTPEIILEANNTIEVYQQPSKVTIRKTSIANRPKPGGPDANPNSGTNGPGGGSNTALIVGVVIAVLVVVGIIVGVVVFMVLKKKKEQVHPEGEDEREVPVPQHTQPPPPQYQYQQPPPSQPYQQPPPQYQYQQPPPSQQYQQPPPSQQYQQPPQWQQYQQPPPQYMYAQPPDASGKHKKDKHKHKKNKDKKPKNDL